MNTDTFEVAPKSWWSWNYVVMKGAERVAEVDFSWWGEKASLRVGEATYAVYREGVLTSAFVLEADSSVVARAEKASFFRREFIVDCGRKSYTFRTRSMFGRGFALFDSSEEVGSITPEGAFTRRMRAELPKDLALPVGVFLVWLVVILWRRNSQVST